MDITESKRNTGNERHPWEVTRVRIIKHLIKENAPNAHHILDIGSGDAYVLKKLKNGGIGDKHTAVDTAYSDDIISAVRGDQNTSISFFKVIPSQLKPGADIVLLLDVLEHCQNDTDLFQQTINTQEKRDFIFLITVPAFQSLFSKHDVLLQHYRRYSIRQLKKLCQSNGLEVIESGYFFFSLLLIRLIQLLLEKANLHKPLKSIDNWHGGPFVTKLLSSILWIDFKFGKMLSRLHFNLPGLSAYCICRPLPL